MPRPRVLRARRHAFAAAIAATGTAIAAAAAFGHIPGVGNGLPPTTSAPDLRSVAIVGSYEPGDGQPRLVKFCFDATVGSVKSATAFRLQTYDSRRYMASATATPSGGGADDCVTAGFDAAFDVTEGSIGEALAGAVADRDGNLNVRASEPLGGSTISAAPGKTTAPDLASATPGEGAGGHKLVTYAFDKIINRAGAVVEDFGYEASNGAVTFGKSAVPCQLNDPNDPNSGCKPGTGTPATATIVGGGSKSIIVDFLTAADAATATRYETRVGAVKSPAQSGAVDNLPVATPSSPGIVERGDTARPKLIAAEPSGPQQYTLTFSKDVTVAGGSHAFAAILDDGTPVGVAASGVGTGGAPNKLLVTFQGAVGDDPSHTVRILSDAGATVSSDGVTGSAASQVVVGTAPMAPGFTNGPDLLRASLNATVNQVTYVFDDKLQGSAPAAAGFTGFAADAKAIASEAALTTTGNSLVVRFPTTVSAAVGFATGYGALRNAVAGVAPLQSVSLALEQGPPPPPAAGPSAGTPTPIVVPARRRVATKFGSFKRRGARYSGRIGANTAACRANRRVILRKKGRGTKRYGSAFTRRDGTFTIRRKRRVGGRVYVFVTEKTTATVQCRAKKSRVIRG